MMMVAWTRTLCHALRVLMLWKLHEITYVHHILPHLTLTGGKDIVVLFFAGTLSGFRWVCLKIGDIH